MENAIPIDAAEITSIRLVEFPGELPLPPDGHVQVGFSTSYGLVVRFSSGLYAGIAGFAPAGPPGPQGPQGPAGPTGPEGPAGSGGGATISGTGGVVETINDPFHSGGITLSPAAGRAVRLNGLVTGADDLPFGVQIVRVPVSALELGDLHNTPKELVAAPADAAKMVAVVQVFMAYHPGATAYTQALGGGGLLIVEQDASFAWTSLSLDDVLAGNDLTRRWAAGNPTGNTYLGTTARGVRLRSNTALLGGDGTLTAIVAHLTV